MKIYDKDQACEKKLNLSIPHWVQFVLITLKRNQIRIKWILKKKDKNLIYYSQHSFAKFKDIDDFKGLSLYSLYKKLSYFFKKINKLKAVDLKTNENKVLKPNVLDNVGDLFINLYYIYKDKYNEEKDGLNTKDKNFYTTKYWDLLIIINTSLKKKKRRNRRKRTTD